MMRRAPVTSEEQAASARSVVETTAAGAELLGSRYWEEVEAVTHGVVRADEIGGAVVLRFLGRGPALIALGRPELVAGPTRVSCRYPIVGGLLVHRAGGGLSLEQIAGDPVLLRSTLSDFLPRLTGALYAQGQARLHAAVTRRYFARLVGEAP